MINQTHNTYPRTSKRRPAFKLYISLLLLTLILLIGLVWHVRDSLPGKQTNTPLQPEKASVAQEAKANSKSDSGIPKGLLLNPYKGKRFISYRPLKNNQ